MEWFEQGGRELVEVFRQTPGATHVWSWTGQTTAAFWARRQAIETTLHAWDAAVAHGDAHPAIDPMLAAEGVDEGLRYFAVFRQRPRSTTAGAGETVTFRDADSGRAWHVRFDGPSMSADTGEADTADAVVTGSAADLLLFLWGRMQPHHLVITGDPQPVERWCEFLPPI